jgi:tetratricopeptide (TPR) repeat protein
VIEIDPDNANAYFNRGCCYDSVGELDLAISDYSVALELDMRNGGGQQQNNQEEDGDEEYNQNYEEEGEEDGEEGGTFNEYNNASQM